MNLQSITYEDIFAITDKLISLTISKGVQDDDHLRIGEFVLLENYYKIYLG
jgi:hypothetical protein